MNEEKDTVEQERTEGKEMKEEEKGNRNLTTHSPDLFPQDPGDARGLERPTRISGVR